MATDFQGVVNGVTYNDINKFNEKIKELINEGKSFEASTTTKSTPDQNVPRALFPHVEFSNRGDRDASFIDKFTNTISSALERELEDRFVPLVETIDNMSKDELKNYIDQLESLGEWFEELKETNSQAFRAVKDRKDSTINRIKCATRELTELQNKIKELERQKDTIINNYIYLNKASGVIEQWDRAYENIYHYALEAAKGKEDKIPMKVANEEPDKNDQVINEFCSQINDLWSQIFGD